MGRRTGTLRSQLVFLSPDLLILCLCRVLLLFLLYFETNSYHVLWLAWNPLHRLMCLGTCGQSSCLCLLGVGITGLQHISTYLFILCLSFYTDMHIRLDRNSSFNLPMTQGGTGALGLGSRASAA